MAAEREVIKEFLYSLGFQVNNSSLKKFVTSLNSMSGMAKAAAGALASVAIAAEAMVLAFSSQMEKLYYASKRSKESVANIQALEFGFSQIGLAGDVARSSIEGLAQTIRNNPGMKGYMDNLLGRDSSKTNPMENMLDLVNRLGKMPHYVGKQIAEQFGIDEKTFIHMRDNEQKLRDAIADRLRMQKRSGVDAERAAEMGMKYMNIIRGITERIEILYQQTANYLLPAFTKFAELITSTLDGLMDFEQGLDFDTTEFVSGVKEIIKYLKQLDTEFGIVDKTVGLLKYSVSTVFNVVKSIGLEALSIIRVVLAATNRDWDGVQRGLNDMARHGQSLIDIGKKVARDAFAASGSASTTAPTAPGAATPPPAAPATVAGPQPTAAPAPGGRVPLGVSLNNPGNLRFAGQTGAVEGRKGFAQFGTATEGLDAMGKQLLRYMSRGTDTIAKIVSKYAPPNENDTRSYINAMSKAVGVDANEQLNLKDPGTLARLMQAMIRHEQGQNPYNAADIQASARRVTGGGSATVSQTNTYHIQGGDAREIGRTVGRAQATSNDQLVRNLSGAVS